jgi:lipid A 3-O-deacylase
MKLTKNLMWFAVWLLCIQSAHGFTPESLIVGYGASIPGFGQTTETVHTLDLGVRFTTELSILESQNNGPIQHEVWIEPVFHVMLSDSDASDSKDYGIATLSFLGAWILQSENESEPYFFLGGGPAFLFADIDGMGSDLNGNYQAGVGIRKLKLGNWQTEFQVKYLHISNLNRAKPNVSLNSIRFALGFEF